MKIALICSVALFLPVFASPTKLVNTDISEDTLNEITALLANITNQANTKRQLGLGITKTGFNADAQCVSNSGKYRYIAPGPNDLRGPCPGLNAMANHGYISRSGVDSVVTITTASNKVYGMGLDLAAALSVYSGIMSGDVTSVSIGGAPRSGLLSSLNLLGRPRGLSASHNNFEMDASPTRADLYKTGNPVALDLFQYEQLMAMPQGPNGYDLSVMHQFRGARFNNSIATNGRFFTGPFALIVTSATYLFTYNLFSNHSAERPDGWLDGETLKSFEGVTGEPGNFQWGTGRERIPDNWYRRAIGNDYGIPAAFIELAGMLQANPFTAVVGGNTGKPNTFTGVNISNLTGGVYNAETLLEGNNAIYFAFQFVQVATPDILEGLLGNALSAVQKLNEVLDPIFASLACPSAIQFDMGLLRSFPGYNR